MMQIIGIGLIAFALLVLQKMIYEKLWNKDLTATISFGVPNIYEGQSGTLKEVIVNRKRLPLPMLKVKFQTDRHLMFEDSKGSRTTDQYYRNDVFQVNGGEKIVRTLRFTAGRRGYYTIKTMDIVSTDLFMTSLYAAEKQVSASLYVYPKIFDSSEFKRMLQQLNGEVLTKRHVLEDPFEHRGIREYQPTDELKTINWKATARTGELKVNQKDYTALHSVRIFLNLEDKGILKKDAAVEFSFQIAAGLCAYFLQQGIRVSCYANGVDIVNGQPVSVEASSSRSQLETVLRALARVDTAKDTVDFDTYFGKRVLEEAKGTINCFISPNISADFADLLDECRKRGMDFAWFYPMMDTVEPVVPDTLQKHIKIVHWKGTT